MQTKKCSKCGEVKAVSEFYKNKYIKDRFCNHCKKCMKQYYQSNKEKVLEQSKKYYQANNEKIKERQKQYRQANNEKMKQYNKQYYQANNEKMKERQKQYRQANNEKMKQYNKQYRQANKEKIKEQRKQYRQDDRNKLADSYIKDLIRNQTNGMLKAKDIPQELIELKRNNIILKRKIKDNGKKTTNL